MRERESSKINEKQTCLFFFFLFSSLLSPSQCRQPRDCAPMEERKKKQDKWRAEMVVSFRQVLVLPATKSHGHRIAFLFLFFLFLECSSSSSLQSVFESFSELLCAPIGNRLFHCITFLENYLLLLGPPQRYDPLCGTCPDMPVAAAAAAAAATAAAAI